MTIGFDAHNLDAAITAVIDEAAKQGQPGLRDIRAGRTIDLTDREEVRAYLIARVQAAYARAQDLADGVPVARIEDVPYRGIGFVFEPNVGEMHPPPVSLNDAARVTYLAIFWGNLSR